VDFVIAEYQTIPAEIYNLLGQPVLVGELNLSAGYYTLNVRLSQFPAGVYFLRIIGKE
jgi:hypothetical protein